MHALFGTPLPGPKTPRRRWLGSRVYTVWRRFRTWTKTIRWLAIGAFTIGLAAFGLGLADQGSAQTLSWLALVLAVLSLKET